jgi:hypothetical protein
MKEHKSIGNIQTCLRKMDIYTLMIDKDILIKLEIKLMFFIALNKSGMKSIYSLISFLRLMKRVPSVNGTCSRNDEHDPH